MARSKHAGDVDDVVKDLKLDQIALRSFRFAQEWLTMIVRLGKLIVSIKIQEELCEMTVLLWSRGGESSAVQRQAGVVSPFGIALATALRSL